MHLRCESGNIYSTSDHNVCVSKLDDAACLFQIVGASKDAVPANTNIKIKHVMTNRILAYNTASGTFCLQTKVKGGAQWRLITGLTKEVDTRELPKRLTRPKEILAKVREILKSRNASHYGIREIGRAFRILDDSGNGSLDRQELKGGLEDFGIFLDATQFASLFSFLIATMMAMSTLTSFSSLCVAPSRKNDWASS